MKVSARNVLEGQVSAIREGVVNAEIELSLPGGDKVVAVVTQESVATLGLAVGVSAVAYIKAPWVMLIAGARDVRFSARNQFSGTVASVQKGAVNTEVGVCLLGNSLIYAVVTNEAAMELGLVEGAPVTALVKASHVILGVTA